LARSGMKVSTFKERFSELFDEEGQTGTDLAKQLHVSRQTLSAWKTGVRSPKEPTVIAIAQYFNVDPAWLMGFDVEKTKKRLKLPADIIPISQLHRQTIPLIGAVAAGEPILATEDCEVYIDAPVKADYALTVEGDSMNPTFIEGDIIYIRQQDDVDDGTVGVVLCEDSACLKHIYHIKNGLQLVSENPKYPPMIRTWPEYDTIRILGKVVGYTRMYK